MKKNRKFFLTAVLFALSLSLSAQTLKQKETSDNEESFSDFTGTVQIALSNADYMVTAGDVYSLTYAANGVPVTYTIAVDPSYKIRVSNLAVLDATGRSYISLKKQVEEIVQKNYPFSGVQFVLLNPASFKVVVTGEVKSTVERNAWALTRLSSVIAGTTTNYSSTRNITIVSKDGTKKVCDLFKADRFGDLSQNPYVRPGDVITIGKINRRVSINGAVERPGSYELLDGENLKDLIYTYGSGLRVQADLNNIELTKIVDTESLTGQKFYLSEKDVKSDYSLNCYDSVYINSYSILKPVIFVEGAIRSTEDAVLESSNFVHVQFEPGTNYQQFIRQYSSWFTATSDIQNAYIIRGETTIPLNIARILFDLSYTSDEVLQENDVLRIPYKQFFVTVSGSVHAPGRYPYIPDRTYDYYIALAGGFIESQNVKGSVVIRDMKGKRLSKSAMITPECNITAKTNSFTYYFSQYAPVFTTILNLILTTVTVTTTIKKI